MALSLSLLAAPNAAALGLDPDAQPDEIEAALAQDRTEPTKTGPRNSDERIAVGEAPGASGSANMNPDLSLILGTALAYFSEQENLQTGSHDPNTTGFNLQELELSANTTVDPYLKLDAHVVFVEDGVELEEAYGTTLALPGRFQARFGQFLHRFGRINSQHPHSWEFVDQPFALGRVFGGEGGRGVGAELSWLMPLSWYVELVASALQANGEGARSFLGEEDSRVRAPIDLLYVAAIKQFFPLGDDWSMLFGLSSALGPNSSGRGNRTDVFGTDLFFKYRPVTRQSQLEVSWQTEVLYRRREVPSDLLEDYGVYTQVATRLTRHWGLALRYEFGSPARGLDGDTIDASGANRDPLDPEWARDRHRFSGNVSYLPTEFSRFRLQGGYDLPGYLDRGIWSAFLAAELVAGAHGAHTF